MTKEDIAHRIRYHERSAGLAREELARPDVDDDLACIQAIRHHEREMEILLSACPSVI